MNEEVAREYVDILKYNIPEHRNELAEAADIISNLKKEINQIMVDDLIEDESHDRYYEKVIAILVMVGELSVPCFELFDELEFQYTLKYRKYPELGKKVWLDHYAKIHHPYSILKNRCYTLLEQLDKCYIDKFKLHPPNWKI
jgi:hypothetical protein